MRQLLPLLLACAAILVAHGSRADVPAEDDNPRKATVPIGKWNVEFANGVKEQCEISDGGHAFVSEPQRMKPGSVEVKDDSVVITYTDDRVERWTSVGKRFVVEHWFPGSGFPTATPVRGIAERVP